MARGWKNEFRVWRTWRDSEGREEAEMLHFSDVGAARGAHRQWASGGWMPPGCNRGYVSKILIFRQPVGVIGMAGTWQPYGQIDETSEVWFDWPETTSDPVRAAKAALELEAAG